MTPTIHGIPLDLIAGPVLVLAIVALFAAMVAADEMATHRLEELYGPAEDDAPGLGEVAPGDIRVICSAGSHDWREIEEHVIEECGTCDSTRKRRRRRRSGVGA